MAGKSIRIQKLERIALERASSVVLFELSDPRLVNVTLTRADLTNDLSLVTFYWSVYGTEADRNKTARALKDAAGHVQREVAAVFATRRSPHVRFEFDPSIEGGIRVTNLIDRLAAERAATEAATGSPDGSPASDDGETDGATSSEEE